jgi:hypothetical protein
MSCPDCVGASLYARPIQLCLVAGEQEQLTAKAASYGQQARRCAHCGLVYLRAASSHRLGWLDGVKGPGFHPARGYA